jgi:DNA sulfur modification protein DndD
MKISRIKTTNFRQHRNVDIDLSSDQADFVIIKGKNGAGKTNLLKAVTWAIYGDLDSGNFGQQLLTDSVVLSMKSGDYEDTEVLVEIDLGSGESAYIKRKQVFKKSEKGVAAYGEPELEVQVFRDVKTGFQVEPDAEGWIERYLPRRFKPYFLFDGEKLERFFQDSDAPKIKSAIQEVARIDVLYRIQEKLSSAANALNVKAAKLTGSNGEKFAKDLGEIVDKIKKKSDEIIQLEEDFRAAEEAEIALDKQLSGQKNLEMNIERKRQIDASLEKENRHLKDAKEKFYLKNRSSAAAVLLAPALQALGEKVEEARRNKVLPPPVDLDYLKQLLVSGICICGSDLLSSSVHSKHLEKVISDYQEVGEIGNALNEHAITYAAELSKLPGHAEVISLMNSSIDDKEDEIASLEADQEALAAELEGQDNETVRNLAKARREQREIAISKQRALNVARGELKQFESRKSDVERDIQKAAAVNAESAKARHKADFANEAAEIAKGLYESMNNQVREAISKSLETRFKSMTWKEGYFKEVSIDPSFRVSIVTNQGVEAYGRLAAGESVCLAFAFSLTLSKEAGLNFPMVVDTPMGRLGPDVQVNLARVIADATRGVGKNSNHQMILLMTETEYNKQVADELSTRRPKVLQINFDTKTSETTVN